MRTATSQPRVQPGVPQGGQWTPFKSSAPTVQLLDELDPWTDAADPQPAEETPTEAKTVEPPHPEPAADPAAEAGAVTPEPVEPAGDDDDPTAIVDDVNDWAEIHAIALRVAKAKTRSTYIDHGDFAEDIAQDVTLSLLKQYSGVKVTKALVSQLARNSVARAAHADRTGRHRENYAHVAGSDMGAWKQYAARRDAIEREIGRALNQSELDEIAREIRQGWRDAKHRPSEGFHITVHHVASETTTEDGETFSVAERVNPVRSAEEEAMEETEGSFMEAALDAVSAADKDGRDKTPLRLLHNALAEGRGVPLVAAGSMSQRQCTKARKVVGTTSEEVLEAMDEWASGVDTERTDLFFAPYGALSNAGKNAVVDMYRDFSDHAGDLYVSALMFANTRQREDAEELVGA